MDIHSFGDGDDGRVIAGRYRLRRIIGDGGMSVVWLATDEVLGRAVAVKEIGVRFGGTSPIGDPGASTVPARGRPADRALSEARASARLTHPGAVTVFDVVRHGDRGFVVMELVEASTLESVVRADGPLAPQRVATIGLRILDVLRAAHRMGIVHRDLKPANVFLTDGDRPRVSDFGIAVVDDDPATGDPGISFGSPGYAAPEQAAGGRARPASDLWALGATLFFAVEGRAPFGGGALPTPAGGHGSSSRRAGPLVRSSAGRAGPLAPALSALLLPDPDARPSAEEAERLLQAAAAPKGGVPIKGVNPSPQPPRPAARRRGRPVRAVAVVALLFAAAWGGWLLAEMVRSLLLVAVVRLGP
jgi:eukaryotic-like serine/threonine-protein kinase